MKTTLLSAILFMQYPLLAQGWTSQTSGTTQGLLSVHFTNANTGWAVGHEGTILHTTNAGIIWSSQTSGTSVILRDVHFVDANRGWVVGFVGTILRTINGGATWSNQSIGTGNALEGVYFTDDNTGWVVGQDGAILHTTNGGITWVLQTSGTVLYLTDVHFTDPNTGWAVGGGGTILHTTNGGVTWSSQSSGVMDFLWAVHFTDASMGWTVGTMGTILHTTNGGATWTAQPGGTLLTLLDVHFTDANAGWIVGGSGIILHTTNGGTTWIPEASGTVFYLTGVYFANPGTGWVSGLGGLILHYSSDAIPCDEIDFFNAKCGASGSARAMVRLLNSTEYAGENVEFRLDDTVYPAELITNGTHTIGRLNVPDAGPGQHTITLVYPIGCHDPIVFNCQSDATSSFLDFDARWAEFDALPAESASIQLIPQETKLLDAYPNPFNAQTTFRFEIGDVGYVKLEIFDPLGRWVATLVDEELSSGSYTRNWDARDVASGVYLCRLQAGGYVETRRLVLIK